MPLLHHFCGYPQVIYFLQKIKMLTLVRTMKYACRYLQISYENYFKKNQDYLCDTVSDSEYGVFSIHILSSYFGQKWYILM